MERHTGSGKLWITFQEVSIMATVEVRVSQTCAVCTLYSFLLMNLRSKMKLYFRVVIAFGIEEPFALRKIDQVAIFVLCNIGGFKTDKFFQLFRIGAADPAGLVKRNAVENNRGAVFVQQPVLDH